MGVERIEDKNVKTEEVEAEECVDREEDREERVTVVKKVDGGRRSRGRK